MLCLQPSTQYILVEKVILKCENCGKLVVEQAVCSNDQLLVSSLDWFSMEIV